MPTPYPSQLERTLDLYIVGDIPREMLTERKKRFQATIDSLERERAELVTQLETRTITDEQMDTIVEFAEEMARGLETAQGDFGRKRRLLDLLDFQATLDEEDGEKVIDVRCKVGQDVLVVETQAISG